jgi:riboflavin kinase / FMN adenylyltransferase
MDIYRFKYGEVPPHETGLTLCLGTFDGLHKGHQQLFLEGRKRSEGPLGVLLFDKNPADLLDQGKSHAILTTLEDKIRLLDTTLGVDVVYVIALDSAFFQRTPDEFMATVLEPLKPALLVVGSDYSFGAQAKGRVADLKKHFAVLEVPLLTYKDKKIGTQGIVKALQEGDLLSANLELGRFYEVAGTVAHGEEIGRALGFPTANVSLSAPYVLPADGVYKGICYLRGFPYVSLINIGTNPTVGKLRESRIECYLEGFKGTAYNETLYVDFLEYLRPEKKFASLDDLKKQMQLDLKSI